MLSKNLPFWKAVWVLSVRLGLDGVSALKGLFSGDTGYFIAILKAHFAFFSWWLFHRGKNSHSFQRKKPLSGYLKKNIAWQHFVGKKKYFSEIVGK